jgi:hypothetical protein
MGLDLHQGLPECLFGAKDGDRTRLGRIDNPLPSQRTTLANLDAEDGFEPPTFGL